METAKYVSADRVLITGESSQLAEQQASFTKLNANIHDLAIYTSDRTNLLQRDTGIGKEPSLSPEGLSHDSSSSNSPEPPGPSIAVEGYGIGL